MNETKLVFPTIGDLRRVQVMEVIEVKRGIGRCVKDDPYRVIYEYISLGGILLARHDPHLDAEWPSLLEQGEDG